MDPCSQSDVSSHVTAVCVSVCFPLYIVMLLMPAQAAQLTVWSRQPAYANKRAGGIMDVHFIL